MPNRRTISIIVRYEKEGSIRKVVEEQVQAEPMWLAAVRAAESKKAQDIVVLDLHEITTLTDHFVILTGSNVRQNQAISDEIHLQLKNAGNLPLSIEGYDSAEWVLMDYGDFIIHIFLDKTRAFYDLERLWRHAQKVEVPAA